MMYVLQSPQVKTVKRLRAWQFLCLLQTKDSTPHSNRSSIRLTIALLKVTADIISTGDQGKVSYLILADQSKSFDLIDHDLLPMKLSPNELEGIALKWFSSYVDDSRYVKIENIVSLQILSKGVPLGNIVTWSCLFCCLHFRSLLTKVIHAGNSQLFNQLIPVDINLVITEINRHL